MICGYVLSENKIILVYTPAIVGYIGPVVVIIHGVDAQQRRVIDASQAVRP